MTQIPAARVARGALAGVGAGVLVLTIENGLWSLVGSFAIPRFAPEIGPTGSFIVSSFIASAYFAPAFLLIACPWLSLVRETPPIGWWIATIAAALLVSGTVSVASAAWLHDARGDTAFIVALSLLPAGIGAGVVLRHWKAVPGDE